MSKTKPNSPATPAASEKELPVHMTDSAPSNLPKTQLNPAGDDQLREDTQFTRRPANVPRRWSPFDEF